MKRNWILAGLGLVTLAVIGRIMPHAANLTPLYAVALFAWNQIPHKFLPGEFVLRPYWLAELNKRHKETIAQLKTKVAGSESTIYSTQLSKKSYLLYLC